ncbi:hypothetical protein B0H19DRAFT_1274905 [Mycena capillaripes]|nr:hypothetical protein B0H19DRAFT_1274905 [Mycena capillaripes]
MMEGLKIACIRTPANERLFTLPRNTYNAQLRAWNPHSPIQYPSNPPSRGDQSNSPFEVRRRTHVACSNCRKRKTKCAIKEQTSRNACARCTKKSLHCEYILPSDYPSASERPPDPEYISVQDYLSAHTSPNTPSAAPSASGAQSHHPSIQAPDWASPKFMPASNNFSHSLATAPPLPYTGPPPPLKRPRYSGSSNYPDLSLHESNQQNTTPQYYLTQDRGHNSDYQYMNSTPTPPSSCSGARQPGSSRHPANYEQMQYYVDGWMPTYEWPSQQGSRGKNPGNDPRYVRGIL